MQTAFSSMMEDGEGKGWGKYECNKHIEVHYIIIFRNLKHMQVQYMYFFVAGKSALFQDTD